MKRLSIATIRNLLALASVVFPVAAQAFNPLYSTGAKHDNSAPVPYYINLGTFSGAANKADLIQGIQNAFQLIEDHPHIAIDFDYLGESTTTPALDGVSVVYLDSGSQYVAGAGVTFFYNIVGSTIVSADIALNGDTHASSPFVNLYGLALHELHHFLGLGHSSTGDDSAVFENTINLDMSPDDIAGLATLYPSMASPLSTTTGTVSGVITDGMGGGISGRIVAYDPTSPQPRVVTANTSADGTYELVGLPPGTYRIAVESAGDTFVHEYLDGGTDFVVVAGTSFSDEDLAIANFGYPRLVETQVYETAQQLGSETVYASRSTFGPVDTYDPVSGSTLNTINVSADDLELSTDGLELYALSQLTRTLSVIDIDASSPAFETVVATIHGLPSQPTNLSVTSRNIAYVVTNGGWAIVAIDMNSRTVLATIPTGRYNQNISFSADERTAYVGAFFGTSSVLEIDIDPLSPNYHTVLDENAVGSNGAWAVVPGDAEQWLFHGTGDGLDIRDLSDYSVDSSYDAGTNVLDILKSPNGQRISFLVFDNDELKNTELRTIDATSHAIVNTVTLGGSYWYLSQGADDDDVLVSGNSGLAVVYVPEPPAILSLLVGWLVLAFLAPTRRSRLSEFVRDSDPQANSRVGSARRSAS
jgi:hypothetical protein